MAAADEPAWEELHAKLHRWAGLLRSRGVAALLDSISATEARPPAGARAAGRRAPADRPRTRRPAAAHRRDRAAARRLLADRLAAAADRRRRPRQRRRGSRAAARLRRRGGPGADHPSQQGPRVPDRLPPVRLAARLHRPGRAARLPRRPERRRLDDRRRRQDGPDIARHRRLRDREQRGEDLRLLYVALTRTMHQATVWWAGACAEPQLAARAPPLRARRRRRRRRGGDAHARRRRGRRTPRGARRPGAGQDRGREGRGAGRRALGGRAAPGRRARRGHASSAPSTRAGDGSRTAASSPARARSRWRREPEVDVVDDELLPTAATADAAPSTDAEEQRLRATPAPLAAMPGGADVGDLLHRVLEATDFASADLDAELAARLAEQRRRRDVDIGDTDAAIAGLAGAIETPLGPSARGASGSATSRRPTASTSSASSCRSSAATRRRARSP